MKNAMKKIMSLMLAAVLLVSVFPMAAAAEQIDDMTGGSLGSTVITDVPVDDMTGGDLGGNVSDNVRSMAPTTTYTWTVKFYNNATGAQIGTTSVMTASSQSEQKTPAQFLAAAFPGWADDWTYYNTWIGATTGTPYGLNDPITQISLGANSVDIYLNFIPNYNIEIHYFDDVSGDELVSAYTINGVRQFSYSDIVLSSALKELNVNYKLQHAAFVYGTNQAQTENIIRNNAYTLSKYADSDGKVTVRAYVNTSTFSEGDRPTLDAGSDVTNNPSATNYATIRFILADGTIVDKKVNVGTEGATINAIMNYYGYNTNQFASAATRARSTLGLNSVVYNGDDITITLQSTSNNGGSNGTNDSGLVGIPSGSTTTYNKFPYNVYLNIYKDTMVGSPDKTINITNGAALDGVVTLDEAKAITMDYYSAKNSYGITFDGLYLAEGTWVTNYVTDTQKYDAFINVDKLRAARTVYINVMIGNANAKNTTNYTADSSNPKTGDSIYTAMTVMGLSAAALATAVYFYNKKRVAV